MANVVDFQAVDKEREKKKEREREYSQISGRGKIIILVFAEVFIF